MAYIRQFWNNGPDSGTPINAARLNYIELGIEHASAAADEAEAIALAAPTTDDMQDLGQGLSSQISAVSNTVNSMRTRLYGGATRTYPPVAGMYYSGPNLTLANATDWPAGPNFNKLPPFTADPDAIFRISGSDDVRYFLVPIAGVYRVTINASLVSSGGGYMNAAAVKNYYTGANRNNNVLSLIEWYATASGQVFSQSASNLVRLAKDDWVYFTVAALTMPNFTLLTSRPTGFGNSMTLEWVSP